MAPHKLELFYLPDLIGRAHPGITEERFAEVRDQVAATGLTIGQSPMLLQVIARDVSVDAGGDESLEAYIAAVRALVEATFHPEEIWMLVGIHAADTEHVGAGE
jgi:hypothetical protein